MKCDLMDKETKKASDYGSKARDSARDLGYGTIDLFKALGNFCLLFFLFLKCFSEYIVLEGLPKLQDEINKNVQISDKPKGKTTWKNPYYNDDSIFKTSLSDFEIESPYTDLSIGNATKGGKKK